MVLSVLQSRALSWYLHGHGRRCHPKIPPSLLPPNRRSPAQNRVRSAQKQGPHRRSSPSPALSWDATPYTCHIPLPAATAQKTKGRHGEKTCNPEKQAGAPQRGLHDGIEMKYLKVLGKAAKKKK